MRDLGNHSLSTLLDARIKFLDSQAEQLNTQLRVIALEREFSVASLKEWDRVKAEAASYPRATKTIKQAVAELLDVHPDGLTKSELVLKSFEVFKLRIHEPSLAPQLQRLSEEGKIEKAGKIWRSLGA